MSPKGQPSKARRQAQNQRERAARAARTEAAAAAEANRSSGPDGGATTPTSSGGGSLLSRLRGGGGSGSSTSARPVSGASRASSAAGGTPVGQRAALSALFAAIAAAIVGSLLFPVPIGRDGEPITGREAMVAEWAITALDAVQSNPDLTPEEAVAGVDDWSPEGTQPYAQAFFPLSLGVLLPVAGTALGLRAVRRRAPAKVVNRTVYVTLFGTLLNAQLLLVFLPAVISLGVAAFQVRKAEVAAGGGAAPSAVDDEIDTAEDPAGDGDVIDVREAADEDADLDDEERA